VREHPAICAAMGSNPPTDEQWEAISEPPIPLAIIAGAGSGKTAIMAARMVWMVLEGLVRPSQLLGLTFTNKAANELEERIGAAFGHIDPSPQELPSVSTYNSFADRIVREHGVRIGIDPESSLLSQAQSWQLLGEALNLVEPFEAIDSRSIASLSRSALGLADQCDNMFVSPEQVLEYETAILAERNYFDEEVLTTSRRRIELARLVRAYMNLKRKHRCIDFGDQVTKAVEILERFDGVTAELRARHPAVLLDEYQDTNVAQRRMMQALCPAGSNVTAVGDARQNIFQWRGSTLFNLIDFPLTHFLRQGNEPHSYASLSTNFRSAARILVVANTVIEKVPAERRPGKGLTPVSSNGEGFVGTALLADQREEARFIAQQIKALHGSPAAPGRNPTQWKDFAILVRRKSHMALIYSVLKDEDIPVEVIGLGGLLAVPEVMDTVAWLRVVADPGPASNRWLARILLGPRFRIHYRDLAVLARWAAARTGELASSKRVQSPADLLADETGFEPDEVAFSLGEALDDLDEISGLAAGARERLTQMRGELKALRARAGGTLLELVRAVATETGLLESLQSSLRKDAQACIANLTQFMGLVANFAPVTGEATLTEFLDYLDAAEEAEDALEMEATTSEDSVKLTTVHRAKGLEFEVVFVPGVAARKNDEGARVDSIFPDERAANPMTSLGQLPFGVREDQEHLPVPWETGSDGSRVLKRKAEFAKELKARAVEDERRLYYVALTRARQRLYVTAAWWYERHGKPRGPSIFFDEVADLPESESLVRAEMPGQNPLLEELRSLAVWPPQPAAATADPLFPEGHSEAIRRLMSGEWTSAQVLGRLDAAARVEADEAYATHRKLIGSLTLGAPEIRPEPAGMSISASQAVLLAAGDLARASRPLPERPSDAALLGTEIHRWIEASARGLTGLADEEGLDQVGTVVSASDLAALKQTFLRMGYGKRTLARLEGGEPMAELRFVLKVGPHIVRGRMDAVYLVQNNEQSDAGAEEADEWSSELEIVDFKSGEQVVLPELDQLAIYAAALTKMGVVIGNRLTLTYCYLKAGEAVSRVIDPGSVDADLSKLEERLGVVAC
jgi:DNA helicase II / ATP-dependent DNA helicase PcrA